MTEKQINDIAAKVAIRIQDLTCGADRNTVMEHTKAISTFANAIDNMKAALERGTQKQDAILAKIENYNNRLTTLETEKKTVLALVFKSGFLGAVIGYAISWLKDRI